MIACRVENIDRPDGNLISRTSELWVSALEAWPIWIAPSFRNMSRVPMHELKHAESVSTNTGARVSDGAGADLWAAGQVSGAVRWRPTFGEHGAVAFEAGHRGGVRDGLIVRGAQRGDEWGVVGLGQGRRVVIIDQRVGGLDVVAGQGLPGIGAGICMCDTWRDDQTYDAGSHRVYCTCRYARAVRDRVVWQPRVFELRRIRELAGHAPRTAGAEAEDVAQVRQPVGLRRDVQRPRPAGGSGRRTIAADS